MMICPVCSKDSDPKFKPFCSKHCADVDLGRWLNESYILPASDEDETDIPDEEFISPEKEH